MPETSLRVTPEELIALNDEIATLVRAGIPLELGLRQLSGSVSTTLGHVSQQIALHLDSGQPLTKSLSETLPGLPRVYVAVVDAGLKSGNLPRALELMSRFVQQGLELRQRIEFAFMYPLTVFILAYVLFLVLVIDAAPRWAAVWGEFVSTTDPSIQLFMWLSREYLYWVWIPPAIVVLAIIWWFTAGRRSFLSDRQVNVVSSVMLILVPRRHRISRWLLGFMLDSLHVVHFWRWSNFCELLSTLLEHQVPLPEAMNLAADATGDNDIHELMSAVSAELETGKSMSEAMRTQSRVPPYLRSVLGSAQHSMALQNALRHGAEIYRSRASFRADMIKMWLPLLLVVVLGGGTALVYALTMSLPLRALYWQLNLDSMK